MAVSPLRLCGNDSTVSNRIDYDFPIVNPFFIIDTKLHEKGSLQNAVAPGI